MAAPGKLSPTIYRVPHVSNGPEGRSPPNSPVMLTVPWPDACILLGPACFLGSYLGTQPFPTQYVIVTAKSLLAVTTERVSAASLRSEPSVGIDVCLGSLRALYFSVSAFVFCFVLFFNPHWRYFITDLRERQTDRQTDIVQLLPICTQPGIEPIT